jgi:hypothetical protein
MSRWNISHIVYYSQHGQNRILEFEPNNATIITGASRTGKTYIIETIDYCLCSSGINLSNHIKKKVSCVGIKLIKDNTEILVAREVPQSSSSSSKMFIEIGNKIDIPSNIDELKGSINESQARILLAERFGLIDFKSYEDDAINISNVSIRQLTPYLFLDKEVIDSKKIILHGLDDPNASKHIIASLPYFLNAIDIEELQALKKLGGLKKGIENEEKKKRIYEQYQTESLERSITLYNEAIQAGLLQDIDLIEENSSIINQLKNILDWQPSKIIFENESRLNNLQSKKSSLLSEVNNLRRKRAAANKNNSVNTEFMSISEKQISKLDINRIFKFDDGNCPICDSLLKRSNEASQLIEKSFRILKTESKVVDEYKPKLDNYIIELDKKITDELTQASSLEGEIQNLIKESEVARNQKEKNNVKLRAIGRISYFLDNLKEVEEFNTLKLDQYLKDYNEINERYGVSNRKEKIQEAERLISNLATKNLSALPIDDFYKDNSINFISKKPTIKLSNNESLEVEEFASIGSDENYLSIHLAFLFALHKFFEIKKSPVPGVLILDQVSRPYYPKDDDQDIIDEDREALEKHFNFIFDQVEKQTGLQVIILEHAYLHKNERYKNATKYRWPRNGTERLIPQDWPDKV